jgi:uncharacterized protein (TIGR02246 family)
MRQHHITKFVLVFSLAIGSLGQPAFAQCLAAPGDSSVLGDDAVSAEQVRDCFYKFQEAWRARDMTFIRSFYAHDPDMLLFFERRQLRGWDNVETLYENMFAHARAGSVKSIYSNVEAVASGEMAYVAANFHLQVTNPDGDELTDEGRVTVVFERRDDQWVVVHRHTSFQAPPGPHRRVPIHTEPGPLWSATLEGAWRDETGVVLLATPDYFSARGVSGLPDMTRYRIAENGILLIPEAGSSADPSLVETTRLTASELVLRLPDGLRTFRRAE